MGKLYGLLYELGSEYEENATTRRSLGEIASALLAIGQEPLELENFPSLNDIMSYSDNDSVYINIERIVDRILALRLAAVILEEFAGNDDSAFDAREVQQDLEQALLPQLLARSAMHDTPWSEEAIKAMQATILSQQTNNGYASEIALAADELEEAVKGLRSLVDKLGWMRD